MASRWRRTLDQMFGGWKLTLTGVALFTAVAVGWVILDRHVRTYDGHVDTAYFWKVEGQVVHPVTGAPMQGAFVVSVPRRVKEITQDWLDKEIADHWEPPPEWVPFGVGSGKSDAEGRFVFDVEVPGSSSYTARRRHDGTEEILRPGEWYRADVSEMYRGIVCVADGLDPRFVPLEAFERLEGVDEFEGVLRIASVSPLPRP